MEAVSSLVSAEVDVDAVDLVRYNMGFTAFHTLSDCLVSGLKYYTWSMHMIHVLFGLFTLQCINDTCSCSSTQDWITRVTHT